MKQYLSLLLVLLMVITPFTVLAQDDTEWKTYTSEDELFNVDYPTDWNVSIPENIPFPAVAFVNGDETSVERFETSETMQSGDQFIMVLLLPGDFLAMMGFSPEEDAVITDIAAAMVEFFMAPDENTTDEEAAAVEISEPDEIQLTDEITAGLVSAKDSDTDGEFVIYEITDNVYGIFMMSTYTGEYTSDLTDLLEAVAASATYDGTSEDIMAAMFATPDTTESKSEDTTTAPSELDGEALVAERCTVCHSIDRINNFHEDESWSAIVDEMIGYGANLNDAEREAVIAYLESK